MRSSFGFQIEDTIGALMHRRRHLAQGSFEFDSGNARDLLLYICKHLMSMSMNDSRRVVLPLESISSF